MLSLLVICIHSNYVFSLSKDYVTGVEAADKGACSIKGNISKNDSHYLTGSR